MRIRPLLFAAALLLPAAAAAQTDPPAAPPGGEVIEIPQPPARSWLGMAMRQEMRISPLGPDADPPVLTAVTPGSPAQAAGLQVGDEILRIDGCDTREACVNWRQLEPGRAYRLRVRGADGERDATLVPAPPRPQPAGTNGS